MSWLINSSINFISFNLEEDSVFNELRLLKFRTRLKNFSLENIENFKSIEKEIEDEVAAKQRQSLLESESDDETKRDLQRALYQKSKSTIGSHLGKSNLKTKA